MVGVSIVYHLEKADLLGDQDFEIWNIGRAEALQRIVQGVPVHLFAQLWQEVAASAEMLFLGVAAFHCSAACMRRRSHVENPHSASVELAQSFCDDDTIAVPDLDIEGISRSPVFSVWVAALHVFGKEAYVGAQPLL